MTPPASAVWCFNFDLASNSGLNPPDTTDFSRVVVQFRPKYQRFQKGQSWKTTRL